MKKLTLILAIALASVCVSCNKDKGKEDPANEDFKKGGKVLAPTEQQKKIEDVTLSALDQIQPSAFKPSMDLITYFVDTYLAEDTDVSEVEEAVNDMIEKSYEYTRNEEEDANSYYCYTFEKLMLDLSKYTGEINITAQKWTYKSADKLIIKFKDQNGKDCVIEGIVSGDLGTVLFDSGYDSFSCTNYDCDGDGYVDYDEYEETNEWEYYVTIPENVQLTMTQAGAELLRAEYKLKTNLATVEDYNDAELDFSATFSFAGYSAKVNRLYVGHCKEAEISTSLSSPSSTIVSESIKVSDVTLNLDSEYGFTSGKAEAKFNLLDAIQVTFNVPDAYKFVQIASSDIDFENETQAKNYCDELNKTFKSELHFDNTAAVQANIELRVIADEDGYYEMMFVLVFSDGSSYAIDEYFTEEMIEKIYNKICALVDEFEALIPEDDHYYE